MQRKTEIRELGASRYAWHGESKYDVFEDLGSQGQRLRQHASSKGLALLEKRMGVKLCL